MGICRFFRELGSRLEKARKSGNVDREKIENRFPQGDYDFDKINVKALMGNSPEDIIDRFLECKDLKIVADNAKDDANEIVTAPTLSEEEDLVSEELARIFVSQQLYSEAIVIYRKLSLLNSEKSVYFAELIKELEKK